jgi:nucleoside-diphosphate-sugar epimerase
MAKKVLIIGGQGFIGFHIVRELQTHNYQVTIGSRSKTTSNSSALIIQIDLHEMSDNDIRTIISDFNVIIFAGGADDRIFPNKPAESYFYNENVIPCTRLATICKDLGVQKLIILGSYFTYFHRLRPEWQLTEKHPYIKSRVLQHAETVVAAKEKTTIITLEIPYVFGATPNKIPLWKPLINYINNWPIVFYTKGGTNIMSVAQVAKATIGVIKQVNTNQQIVLGNENVTWKQLIGMIAKSLGKKRVVISIPTFTVKFFAYLTKLYFRIRKKQSGLDVYHFVKVQASNTYVESQSSIKLLNYQKVDMQKTIDETVEACKI